MWWWVLTKPGVTRQPVGSEGAAGRRFAAGGAHAHDEAVVDRHPTASHFPARVHGGHQLGAGDDEVDRPGGRVVGLGHFGESSRARHGGIAISRLTLDRQSVREYHPRMGGSREASPAGDKARRPPT